MEDKRDNIQPEEKIEAVEETDSREYNASFEEEDPISSMSEDELQDELLRDSGMNGFQRYVAKLDDKKFNLYQRILGVLLAIGSSVALFWNRGSDTDGGPFSWSLIIAVLIALMVPNIIEKQSLRKIPKARNTLAITMLIIIVIYFLVIGFRSGFKFTNG